MSNLHRHAVNFAACKKLVLLCLRAKIVPIIESSPGIGKSAMMKEIAEEQELLLLDERLSTMEPTDLNGYPSIYEHTFTDANGQTHTQKRAGFIPMDNWPLEGAQLPINPKTNQPYKGWLLFLDEIRSATPATQAAAYRLLLDRQIGRNNLHPRCLVVGASNRLEDNAVVFDAGTAFQSRVVWLELRSDLTGWMENFAIPKGLDSRVTGFLNYKGQEALNKFNPDHDEKNFPCERTWEAVSKLLSKLPAGPIDLDYVPVLAGTIGSGAAIELQAFSAVYQDLITLDDIAKDPMNCIIDTRRPDIMYALVSNIQSNLNTTNIGNYIAPLMQFVDRVAMEFQAMLVKHILNVDPSQLQKTPSVAAWVTQKAAYLSSSKSQVAAQPMPQAPAKQDDDDDDQP